MNGEFYLLTYRYGYPSIFMEWKGLRKAQVERQTESNLGVEPYLDVGYPTDERL